MNNETTAEDEEVPDHPRLNAIREAQALVKKYTKGRSGLVREFLLERREVDRAVDYITSKPSGSTKCD